MIPSPSDLSYFVEAALTLNFTRASERLGISQPSLTLSIQRLETSVGVPLFIRGKKGVTLTQAGKQLQASARALLDSWNEIKGRALHSMTEIEGSFTIGCHRSVGLYSLGGFLPALLGKNPRLEIRLSHDASRKVTESIVQMKTDVGIVINPTPHPDLVVQKLGEDEVAFYVGAGKRKTQDPRSGQAILICDLELDLLQNERFLKQLAASGLRYRRVLSTSSLEVVAELAAQGAGIAILPGRVAARAARPLSRIKGTPTYRDEICLVYRVENRGVRAIQAINEAIVGYFKRA